MGETARRAGTGAARDSAVLGIGMASAGLLAYGFIVIGTRSIGAAAFAPVSVLWTVWAVTAAFVTFPLQHWVIRSVEVHGDAREVAAALHRIASLVVVLALAILAGTWFGREALFGRVDATFPILASIIPVGAAAVGLQRGVLSGQRRFVATAATLVAEALLRVAAGGIIALLGGGAAWFGGAMVAGFLVVGGWARAMPRPQTAEGADHRASVTFLAGVAGGSVIAQLVLTGGPLAAAVAGASPVEITGLFSALALCRAPYLVATGVAARLTGGLTRLVVAGDGQPLRRARDLVALGTALAAVLSGVGGGLVGPRLLRSIFGMDVHVDAVGMAVVAAGSAVAVGALVGTLFLVAADRGGAVLRLWVVALAAALPITLWAGPDAALRAAVGMAVGEAVAAVGAALAWGRVAAELVTPRRS